MTGLDLKLERVRARIKAKVIAEAMGVSASRVAKIEREADVSVDIARRYREAIALCGTSGTSVVA